VLILSLDVTVSPRIANGNSEPSFAPEIKLDILQGTGIVDEMFVLKAVCRSCRVWPGGFLDASKTAQPMIYAFGPGNPLQSDDPNVSLKRHTRYGKFDMNMVEATGKGEVPAPSTTLSGVVLRQGPVKDHHRKSLAHAILGCLALFVLWPLNVLLAGFLRNIRIHVAVSIFILMFLVASFGLGISVSKEFNRVGLRDPFFLDRIANRQIVKSFQLAPPDLRLYCPLPNVTTFCPTHKSHRRPTREDTTPPRSPNDPDIRPPRHHWRPRPALRLRRQTHNARLYHHRPSHLCLPHPCPILHQTPRFGVRTRQYKAAIRSRGRRRLWACKVGSEEKDRQWARR
jgi:hypothetical protein